MTRRALFALALALATVSCTKERTPEPPTSTGTPPSRREASGEAPAEAPIFDASAVLPLFADAGLTARERDDFASVLSQLPAPCPSVAVSLAQCIAEHRACADCLPAARYLTTAIHAGWPGQYVGAAMGARFDPEQVKDLPIDGSPTKGAATAPITIVEFGSYICPHCAAEAPKLDALLAAHPKELRLVFKPVGPATNETCVRATRAVIAAGAQGKFWEMHSVVFAGQAKLADSDLDVYAQSIGLDMARFHADMAASATSDRMERDRALAKKIGVDSIPAMWINGHALLPFESLEQRMAFELAQLPAAR